MSSRAFHDDPAIGTFNGQRIMRHKPGWRAQAGLTHLERMEQRRAELERQMGIRAATTTPEQRRGHMRTRVPLDADLQIPGVREALRRHLGEKDTHG